MKVGEEQRKWIAKQHHLCQQWNRINQRDEDF